MSTWNGHLVRPESLGTSWDHGTAAVLAALVAHARQRWPLLDDGIRALENASRRTLTVGDESALTVELFCNPARMSSVTAEPTPQSWCPLCAANVPAEEQGIPVGDDLVALPNPAPILRDHVVFAHRDHVDQALAPCLDDLTWLLARSGDDVVYLYNGPSSGASSPYHRHLQAGRLHDLPLTTQAGLKPLVSRHTPWGRVDAIEAGARRFLLLTIDEPSSVPPALRWSLRLLARDREHPLNLLLWRRGDAVVGALFPRSRHRPSCFFLPDQDRIVVSPGCVEMGGLVVLPRQRDWQRLDSPTLQAIYREVGADDATWHLVRGRIVAEPIERS